MKIPVKILLLTKNYPPQIGGVEKYSYDLYNSLVKEGNDVKLVAAWSRNEWLLIKLGRKNYLYFFWKFCYIVSEFFRLIYFALKSFIIGFFWTIWFVREKNNLSQNIIWPLDGSIAWIGYVIQSLSFKKNWRTRVTLHGTDVVWPKPMYQEIMPWFWQRIDEIIVVSNTIKQEATKRSVQNDKIKVVEHSLEAFTFTDTWFFNPDEFLRSHNVPTDKVLLFSLGRFIEIKGFHWFLSKVMPSLDHRFYYVLWWLWPFESSYRKIIREKKLINVLILGPIRDPLEKARWFSTVDYYVMPNISTWGVEWFGIVLLEAQYYGTRCIVSDVNGIAERSKKTDIILPAENEKEWIKAIENI